MARTEGPWADGLRHGGVAAAILAALVVGYWVGAPDPEPEAEHAHEEGAEPTVWTCSMHPQVQLPEPGDCPICGMDLIPLEPGGGADERRLTLSPAAKKRARVRSAPAERRWVAHQLTLLGEVTYDATRLREITAWFPGRIDRMFVDYEGMRVREDDHLYRIYSPELVVAHQELLQAQRTLDRLGGAAPAVRATAEQTLEAVRAKLRRWGLANWQIRKLEKAKKPQDRVTLYAPQSGVVIERAKVEGDYVETGTRIYRIAELDEVWLEAWAFEHHLPWLRFGQKARFTVDAVPGRTFEGRVSFIAPYLDDTRRATRVRVAVPNPDGLLKPGMFAQVRVHGELAGPGRLMVPELAGRFVCPMHPHEIADTAERCDVCGMRMVEAEKLGYALPDADAAPPLVIPASAPLITGERAVVYVEVPDADEPTYEGREIVLGPRAGDHYVVVSGLAEGERVVVEGNFKLDAALQIRAKPSMMNPPASQPTSAPTSQPASAPAAAPEQVPEPEKERSGAKRAPRKKAPAELASLITPYLALQKALAADDADGAVAAWAALRTALGASKLPAFDGAARAALREAAGRRPKELEGLRAAFGVVSARLVSLLKAHPEHAPRALTVFHCPMAFGNAGASWLQATDDLLNPYFGASMLGCGRKVATVPAP